MSKFNFLDIIFIFFSELLLLFLIFFFIHLISRFILVLKNDLVIEFFNFFKVCNNFYVFKTKLYQFG